MALNDELLVFTERGTKRGYGVGLEVVLVRSIGGKLEELSRVPTSFSHVEEISAGFWPSRFGLHLVRLSSHRLALVGRGGGSSGATLDLFDADSSGLELVATQDLSLDGVGAVTDAEGHGDRLWLLSGSRMTAYGVSDAGEVTWLSRFSTVASASAFAASADDQLLYVGSQRGTFRVDVSDLGNPKVEESPVIAEEKDRRPNQLTLLADRLLIQSEGLFFTLGDARLYGVPDHRLIHRFPSATMVDSPLGAAFTKEGVLVQRLLYENSLPSELRADLYRVQGSSVELSDSFTYADLSALELEEADTDLVPFAPTAQGSLAVLGPSRRVISTSGGDISEVTGPLHGGFDSVRPAGPDSVLALGRESSHRIALGPAGPSLVQGELFPVAAGAPQRLLSLEGDALETTEALPLIVTATGQRLSSGRIAWLGTAAGQAAHPQGFLNLEQAVRTSAWQAAGGGLLLRLEPSPNDGSGMLRVYALPTSRSAAFPALEPYALPAVPSAYLAGLAADRAGSSFVVARNSEDGSEVQVTRYQRQGRRYEPVSTFTFPSNEGLDDILSYGTTLILLYDNKQEVLVLSHDDSGFHELATKRLETKSGGTIASRALLGVEGERLYLSNGYEDDVQPGVRAGVDALRLSDLAMVGRYETPQEMTSFTVSDQTLIFTGPSAIVTAAPQCAR